MTVMSNPDGTGTPGTGPGSINPASNTPSSGGVAGGTGAKSTSSGGGGQSQKGYYGPWLVEPKDSFLDGETAVKNLTEEQIEEFRKAFK